MLMRASEVIVTFLLSSPFFYLAFDNELKANKANPALFFDK